MKYSIKRVLDLATVSGKAVRGLRGRTLKKKEVKNMEKQFVTGIVKKYLGLEG